MLTPPTASNRHARSGRVGGVDRDVRSPRPALQAATARRTRASHASARTRRDELAKERRVACRAGPADVDRHGASAAPGHVVAPQRHRPRDCPLEVDARHRCELDPGAGPCGPFASPTSITVSARPPARRLESRRSATRKLGESARLEARRHEETSAPPWTRWAALRRTDHCLRASWIQRRGGGECLLERSVPDPSSAICAPAAIRTGTAPSRTSTPFCRVRRLTTPITKALGS